MSTPLVWLIWDGAAAWVTRRLLREGRLPALAEVARAGSFAETRPAFPNCQTPPSLATLLTGRPQARHGVTGFHVPATDPDSPATASRSGFARSSLRSRPLWERARRARLRAAVVHLPWTGGEGEGEGEREGEGDDAGSLAFAVDGFARRVARGDAFAVAEGAGPGPAGFRVGPYAFTLARDAGGLTIAADGDESGGRTGRFTAGQVGDLRTTVAVEPAPGVEVVFRTWRRPDDRSLWLIHQGAWGLDVRPNREGRSFRELAGPFVGDALGRPYRRGVFGPRLAEGGTGTAEGVFLAAVGSLADHFRLASLHALDRGGGLDVLFAYQPCIDAVEHELLGWCDPAGPAYLPEAAERAWAGVEAAYRMSDRHLGDLLREVGPGAPVVVSSDHGMAGIRWNVHVNEVLRREGFLAFRDDGTIDPSRTLVFYHPANNGSLWVNVEGRPGGIVPARRRVEEARRVAEVLRHLRGPGGEGPIFPRIYPLDAPVAGAWSPRFGDLALGPADGFHLRAGPGPGGAFVTPAHKSAAHLTYSDHPSLRGIFCGRGAGLEAGGDLGLIGMQDVAAIVRRQLGRASGATSGTFAAAGRPPGDDAR